MLIPIEDNDPMTGRDVITLGVGRTIAGLAPRHGGRLASITVDGTDLLVRRHSAPDTSTPLAWGCYPMVPWAGRIRNGHFEFRGRRYAVPVNHGAHAIHGVGFTSPWVVTAHDATSAELELALPRDDRWPFGGTTRQRIDVLPDQVRLSLSVTADDAAFPASIGWHPWFRKPDRIDFRPSAMYRRDSDGVAVDELIEVPPGPWDDCFVNDRPVVVTIDGVTVTLRSDCTRWVVYDMPPHASCFEPQTGPPDAFNIAPQVLEPGTTLTAWATMSM